MTTSVGVHEAETQLSQLLRLVADGEEVIITRRGHDVAKLVPMGTFQRRELGFDRGRFPVPADFDEPLPEEVLEAFEQ